MSNVLPPDVQKEIWSSHRANFILVGSLVLFVGAFLALLTLLPSIIATGIFDGGAGASKNVLLTEIQAEEERNEILRARMLVTQFSPLASSTALTFEALTAALKARPKGALVQEIQYTQGDKGKIILSGTAADRTAISAYRTALDEVPYFESISVPVGAFAGAEGGRFSITLTGEF